MRLLQIFLACGAKRLHENVSLRNWSKLIPFFFQIQNYFPQVPHCCTVISMQCIFLTHFSRLRCTFPWITQIWQQGFIKLFQGGGQWGCWWGIWPYSLESIPTAVLNSTVVPVCMFLAPCALDKLCHHLEHIQSCMCGVTKAGFGVCLGCVRRRATGHLPLGLAPSGSPAQPFNLKPSMDSFMWDWSPLNTTANIERDSIQTQTHLLSYSPHCCAQTSGEHEYQLVGCFGLSLCIECYILYSANKK